MGGVNGVNGRPIKMVSPRAAVTLVGSLPARAVVTLVGSLPVRAVAVVIRVAVVILVGLLLEAQAKKQFLEEAQAKRLFLEEVAQAVAKKK